VITVKKDSVVLFVIVARKVFLLLIARNVLLVLILHHALRRVRIITTNHRFATLVSIA